MPKSDKNQEQTFCQITFLIRTPWGYLKKYLSKHLHKSSNAHSYFNAYICTCVYVCVRISVGHIILKHKSNQLNCLRLWQHQETFIQSVVKSPVGMLHFPFRLYTKCVSSTIQANICVSDETHMRPIIANTKIRFSNKEGKKAKKKNVWEDVDKIRKMNSKK